MAVIRNAVFRLYILHAACSMCCYPTYSIWDHRLPRTREPFHRCLSLWIGSNSFNSTMDPGNYKISLLSCFFSNDISQTSIFLYFSPPWSVWPQSLWFFMIIYILVLFLFLFFSTLLEIFSSILSLLIFFSLNYLSSSSFSHFLTHMTLLFLFLPTLF